MSDEYERDDEDENYPPTPPRIKPPSMPPPLMPPPSPAPPMPPAPSYEIPSYEQETYIPQGPSQEEYNSALSQVQAKDTTIYQLQSQMSDINAQCANLNAQLIAKDNQMNQLRGQLQNLQKTIEEYQNQITNVNNEKAQLQAQIPQLQNNLQILQQENMTLQQQIAPLHAQINKLQEELAYKDRRIQELKEPKAVMPSSLAQGITSQTTGFGEPISFGAPTGSSMPSTPTLGTSSSSGRKICPNCGATGFAIKEVEDKTKIISYIPKPQYAKKNICTKCGFEF
jgi:DNA repair exonuclease SbcCD ATPase subunit